MAETEATDEASVYDEETSALLHEVQARCVFVVVLNGIKGSDCSLQFMARNAEDAELWGRRMVSQARRALDDIEQELNNATTTIVMSPPSSIGPEH